MSRLWAKIIERHKIRKQATEPCTFENIPDVLRYSLSNVAGQTGARDRAVPPHLVWP